MKKIVLSQIIFMSAVFFACAQQLKGIVYYQNSNGKPAAGVRISAFNCNPTYSKTNGMFILNCTGKKPGQKLKLIMGYTDGEGKHIEVVNSRQLEWLRIPDNPDALPVEIIICYAGQRNEVALQYYDIFIKALVEEYERMIQDIKTQLREKTLSDKAAAILITQIEELRKERDAALKKVREQAQFIASINQDQASGLVKAALQKIRQEDIDAALAILDTPILEESYQAALAQKRSAESQLQQVIEGYELKISLLLSKFKYEEATYCYDRMIEIYKSNDFDKEALAKLYIKAASTIYHGRYKTALKYQQEAISILEAILDPKSLDLGMSYWYIALTYKRMKAFQKAMVFQEKCLAILPDHHPNYQNVFNARLELSALDAYKRKKYSEALQDFKSLSTFKEYSWILNLIGPCHYHLTNYTKAIAAYQKAVATNPDIRAAYFYNNIGMAYVKNSQFKEARNAFKEYEKRFPNRGRSYRNWAMYYALQGKKDEALQMLQKAVALGYKDREWITTDDSIKALRNEKAYQEIIRDLEEEKISD